MSFIEALTSYTKSPEEIAGLAPSHISVINTYLGYIEVMPRSTVLMFLNRLLDVVQSTNAATRSIDFSFMDLRKEDTKLLERIFSLPNVRYIDLRRGNFRLHTEQTLRMIHEVITSPSSAMVRVFIYPCDLPEYLKNSPKLQCAEDSAQFEELMQRDSSRSGGNAKPPGSPLRRKPPMLSPQLLDERRHPKNMQEALETLREHKFTAVQVFEDPGSIDTLLNELRSGNRPNAWQDIVDACRIIHHVLPHSVVHWAREKLVGIGLDFAVYNKEKLDSYYQGLPDGDENTRKMLKRCVDVMRRHIGMVLDELGYNEKEAQEKMDSLRKKAESYKNGRRFDDARELEEVMSLVIDWKPEFGFSVVKKREEPPKVEYQVVRRAR